VRVRIIGAGRAGGSFAIALTHAGWPVEVWDRSRPVVAAAHETDLVLIATPDHAIAEVSAAIEADERSIVAHLSGATPLAALGTHSRRAAIHPLMTLPDPTTGAASLRDGWCAISGDASSLVAATDVVAAVGARSFVIAEEDRAIYHAAACVASNHVVALLGQVERLAAAAGVPFAAFRPLVQASIDNAFTLGPRDALTGPAARGDWGTIERHLHALLATEPIERAVYLAGVRAARLLAVGSDDTPRGLVGHGGTGAAPDGWPSAGQE
jgi:predicted short-subunit dehydrogenase-like oxidoreductase (DUF2520 family)